VLCFDLLDLVCGLLVLAICFEFASILSLNASILLLNASILLLKVAKLQEKISQKCHFFPIFARKTKNPYKSTHFP